MSLPILLLSTRDVFDFFRGPDTAWTFAGAGYSVDRSTRFTLLISLNLPRTTTFDVLVVRFLLYFFLVAASA
jgi:hypothetical protein